MDEKYQLARDFFLKQGKKLEGTLHATWYTLSIHNGKNHISSGILAPCHASMQTPAGQVVCVSSVFAPNEEQMTAGMLFWDWITGDESPWKSIVKDIELIINPETDRPIGWIIKEDVASKTPYYFLKNFAIATRVFTEHWKIAFCLWENLHKKGMHGTDILYFITKANKGSDIDCVVDATSSNDQGWHWPLCDYQMNYPGHSVASKCIDWTKYRSGVIGQTTGTGQGVNGFFMHPMNKKLDYIPWKMSDWCKAEKISGRFARSNYFKIDDAIEGFYKWQDKYGIRDSDK